MVLPHHQHEGTIDSQLSSRNGALVGEWCMLNVMLELICHGWGEQQLDGPSERRPQSIVAPNQL